LHATAAYAAGGIRIERPIDGATVRENVNILVPVSAVPRNGFVIYSIDGHLTAAADTKSSDGKYFVYTWDTQSPDPNVNIPVAERRPRDGRHTVEVQGCDAAGDKSASKSTVVVYVRNHISPSTIPSSGIRLRYTMHSGAASSYGFHCVVNLKRVRGADINLVDLVGKDAEGDSGVVKRSVEYLLDSRTAFVSQQLVGNLRRYSGGKATLDNSLVTKRGYESMDSIGEVHHLLTSSAGSPVGIDLPVLPAQNVRIGDVWRGRAKVLWDPVGARSASLSTTSTFEGLEWSKGNPCAKIRTVFSGSARIPFSNMLTSPVSITGETVTYFAYKVGKVVRSDTTASGSVGVGSDVVASVLQPALPSGTSLFPGQTIQSQQGAGVGQSFGGPAGAVGAGAGGGGAAYGGPAGPGGPGMMRRMMMSRAGGGPARPGMPGNFAGGMPGAGMSPGNVGGPPGMGTVNMPGGAAGLGMTGAGANVASQTVDVDFSVKETLDLLQ
jgi:hypothetical protein